MASHAEHAVLVVDDNDDIRQVLELFLESEGYRVSTARDGEEALRLMSEGSRSPCAVVLDLMMPVMDGFEFLKRQEQIPAASAVPVIVISANQAPEPAYVHPNVRHVFRKPFAFLGLINAIQDCCRK